MRGWWSRLHVRLAVLVFSLELLLLATLGISVSYLCRRAFTEAFDQALVADARTLAASYDVAEEPPPAGHGPVAGTVIRVPETEVGRGALFAVFDGAGALLARSPEFRSRPGWATGTPGDPAFGTVFPRDRHWRGVYFVAEAEPDARARGISRTAFVLFARSTREVDERLEDIRKALALALGALLLVTGPLAGILASRALAPVRRLEAEARVIGGESQGRRLILEGVPADLEGLARAVNGMLDRLERVLDRERSLAEDAAHELRTPVAGLKAAIQAAQVSPRDPEEDRRTLADLLEEVVRLESLCEGLLLAAVPAKAATVPVAPGELCRWVGSLEEAYGPRARAAGGVLDVRVSPPPPGTPDLLIDELTVRQILTNLLENAILHGGPGPWIGLSMDWTPDGALVTVEDDGPGVPVDSEAKIFERFFRTDRARARTTGGAGLGLAICRNLAEASGGSVRYDRTPSGASRFTWRIRSAGVAP